VAGPLKNGEVVASWRNTSRNSFSSGVRIVIFTAPVALSAGSSPLAVPLEESSSSRTGCPVQPLRYTPAMSLPRTWLLTGPIPQLCQRTVAPGGSQAAPARSCPVEIRLAAHITGSPLPPALGKGTALRSGTTRRASRLLSDRSSGTLRLGHRWGRLPVAYNTLIIHSHLFEATLGECRRRQWSPERPALLTLAGSSLLAAFIVAALKRAAR